MAVATGASSTIEIEKPKVVEGEGVLLKLKVKVPDPFWLGFGPTEATQSGWTPEMEVVTRELVEKLKSEHDAPATPPGRWMGIVWATPSSVKESVPPVTERDRVPVEGPAEFSTVTV
jgi:hypothetical protein